MSVKKAIERACAEARLQGVNIYEVFADPAAFKALEKDPCVEQRLGQYRETELVLMTCNGPCRVKKDR